LTQLAEEFPIIDVRGHGLMVAIELGGSDGGAAPYGAAAKLTAAALKEDLLLLTAGAREVVRFLPPLTVSASEVDECLERLRRAMMTVYSPAAAHLANAAAS
jgi:4-aminobutyrate aminotransferase